MAITTNNVQNVRFLRNGSLYGTRDAALTGLNGQTLAAEQDGSIILARYGSGDEVKTLVGLVYVNGDNKSLTIFDIEGASGDVEALRTEINNKLGTGITSANTATAQLTALSGNSSSTSAETSVEGAKRYADGLIDSLDVSDAAVEGNYVSQVSEADGKIAVTRVALPDASSVADDNKVVTDVTQSKGKITATASNITGVKLAGYEEGTDADIAATDTLGQALGKLQAQINAMDLTAVSGDGEVITLVSEDDGKVSAEKTAIKDVKLTGYVKDTTKTGDIAATDDIEDALSKLENKAAAITIGNDDDSINVTTATSGTNINVNIKSGEHVLAKDGNAGIYTNISLSSITPSSTTVKEEYSLIGTDGTVLGTNIKIYKDSSIVEIYLGTSGDSVDATTGVITKLDGDKQYLNYVYLKADGTYEMTKINISVFITEQEFASGVTFDSTENKVKGVVDPASEKNSGNTAFLTVGADGFKVNGIKQEIIDRINELDASVTGGATAGTATSNHIQVVVDEADGKLTAVTVTETNIADKTKLEELSAKTVTEIASSNASISAVSSSTADGTVKYDVVTDASKIKMSGFTAAESGFTEIEQFSSVTEAFKAVETYVLDNEEVVSNSLNDLNERIDELSGGTTSGLTEEIAERRRIEGQNGSAYTANVSSSYISGATSLNDADVKLDAALKSLSDATVNEVQVNGVALAETSNAVNVQISAAAGTGAANSPITVDTDSSTGAVTLKLEGLDCGTY